MNTSEVSQRRKMHQIVSVTSSSLDQRRETCTTKLLSTRLPESSDEWLVDILICKANLETQPSIAIDLEGENLGLKGTISIIQIYLHPLNIVAMVDVATLGGKAFCTKNQSGFR